MLGQRNIHRSPKICFDKSRKSMNFASDYPKMQDKLKNKKLKLARKYIGILRNYARNKDGNQIVK